MIRNPSFILLIIWVSIAALTGGFSLDAEHIYLDKILLGPQASAWLGYDELGREVLPRLAIGARTSLLVAFSVISISLFIGTSIGIIAGWYGGYIDKLTIIIIDVFMAFPGILLAIVFAALLGPGIINTAFSLSLVGWVGFARLTRAQALSLKQRRHVEAARALGQSDISLVLRHILPLLFAPLIVEATFALSGMVIAEASLSFLGLGVQPPTPSWGNMIREGTRYILIAPHLVLAPTLCIFLVVLSINLLGDKLRDISDKKLHL